MSANHKSNPPKKPPGPPPQKKPAASPDPPTELHTLNDTFRQFLKTPAKHHSLLPPPALAPPSGPPKPKPDRKTRRLFNEDRWIDHKLQKLEDPLIVQLRRGSPIEKAAALTQLVPRLAPAVRLALDEQGIQDPLIEQLLGAPAFLKNAAILCGQGVAPLDRIGAALALSNALKQILPREQLPNYLRLASPQLPSAAAIVEAAMHTSDASRRVEDRLIAAIELARSLQEALPPEMPPKFLQRFGNRFPLAQQLAELVALVDNAKLPPPRQASAILDFVRKATPEMGASPHRLLSKLSGLKPWIFGASTTLFDPDQSLRARAAAIVQIWKNPDGTLPHQRTLREALESMGLSQAADLAYTAAAIALQRPDSELPELGEFTELAAAEMGSSAASASPAQPAPPPAPPPSIEQQIQILLMNVDHVSQVQTFLRSLERLDPADPSDDATRKALLGGLSSLDDQTLRDVLTSDLEGKPLVSVLADVLHKLPTNEAKQTAAEILRGLDAGGIRLFLKLSSQVSIEALGLLFRGQSADAGQSAISDAINTLADVLRNPEKSGKADESRRREAIEGLQKLSEAPGEIGQKALRALQGIVADFQATGPRGLEALQHMARIEGKSAELALPALQALAIEDGLALEALQSLSEELPAARPHLDQALLLIAQQGTPALQSLAELARRPGATGTSAQKTLQQIVLKEGAAAEGAYQLLVWLEKQGIEALSQLRRTVFRQAEKYINVLDWIARNPGRSGASAMMEAVQSLQDVAEVEEKVAIFAKRKLEGLALEKIPAATLAAQALASLQSPADQASAPGSSGDDEMLDLLGSWSL